MRALLLLVFLPISTISFSQTCDPGQYWNGFNCLSCPPGFYCQGGTSSPLVCPAGNYCPEASITPMPCPANTYNPYEGAIASENCLLCPPGQTSEMGSMGCYVIGDSFCDNFNGENCENSPADCPCQEGFECNNGECTYSVIGHVGINNENPRLSLDVSGGFAHRGIEINVPFGEDTISIPNNLSFATLLGYSFTPIVAKLPDTLINGHRIVIQNRLQSFARIPTNTSEITISPYQSAEFICSQTGWSLLNMSIKSENFWSLDGNSGVNSSYQAIGTNDSMALAFKVNNTHQMVLQNSGSLNIKKDILTDGIAGSKDQVLTSNGDGTMRWALPQQSGSILEVNPAYANIDSLVNNGYTVLGTKDNLINVTTNGGGLTNIPHAKTAFGYGAHLFYYAPTQKIYIVRPNSISSFSIATGSYGDITTYSVPSFNLVNKLPVFTGTTILIYPHFIFNCSSNTTSSFPANPCSGFEVSNAQVWTGTQLIILGPEGGIEFTPSSGVYECFDDVVTGYQPNGSALWTGTQVIYYGGYILSLGDTISVDLGSSYNPTTNTFESLGSGGPLLRNHLTYWDGDEMIIVGGRDNSFHNFTIYKYRPSTFTWTTGPLFLASSKEYGRLIASDNKLFVSNYIDSETLLWQSFGNKYYNLTSNTVNSLSTPIIQVDKSYLNNAVLANNLIHYFPNPFVSNTGPLSHFIFNPSNLTNAPGYATNILSILPYKITDGLNYSLAFGEIQGGLVFNKSSLTWTRTSTVNMPTERQGHVLESIGNDKFIVWGGKNGATHFNNGYIYDAVLNTWTTIAASPLTARFAAGSTFTLNKLYICGGINGVAPQSNSAYYDVFSNTWTTLPSSNHPPGGDLQDKVFSNSSHVFVTSGSLYTYNIGGNFWLNTNTPATYYPADFDGTAIIGANNANTKGINITNNENIVVDLSSVEGFTYYRPTRVRTSDFILLNGENSSVFNPYSTNFSFSDIVYDHTISATFKPLLISGNVYANIGSLYLENNFNKKTDLIPLWDAGSSVSRSKTVNMPTTILRKL